METNRRKWLKQVGLGAAGIGLANLNTFAAPIAALQALSNEEKQPIKLSSNENPYGPSPLAKKAFLESIFTSNRYNWESTSALIEALANNHQVTAGNILLGAGSTEIIDVVARYAAREKGSLVIADPSYAYWTETASKLGLAKIKVPLTTNKKIDLPAMLAAMKADTRLVYICNPNNPTGTVCDRNALLHFVEQASKQALVLIDEAYLDYTKESSLQNRVMENKQVVIAKTYSKIYGLAGARIGYAIAHHATIEKLSEQQSWANGSISVASTAAALASLKDKQFMNESYTRNQTARDYTIEQLQRLNLNCIPSQTNFVYFSLDNYPKDYFRQLKENNISGTYIYEEKGKWTRITVGTMQEMQQFIHALQ